MTTLHEWLVFLSWLTVPSILCFAGCAELDRVDDPVADLGEEPIDAAGWDWASCS